MQAFVILKDGKVVEKLYHNTPRMYFKEGTAKGAASNIARQDWERDHDDMWRDLQRNGLDWRKAKEEATKRMPSIEEYRKQYSVVPLSETE